MGHLKALILKCNQTKNDFEISQILNFCCEKQLLRLEMEYNFIHMAVVTGHAVAYTICLIFKHITDYVQLYCTNYLLTLLAITTRLTDFGLPQYLLPGASALCAPTPVGYTNR